jgi:hypothetical protein
MKGSKTILCLLVLLAFLTATLLTVKSTVVTLDKTEEKTSISLGEISNNGWYYLQGYPNYAPNGMPDFCQIQDGWGVSFCGPTAAANVLWYIDSKYADSNGHPGDGIDSFPLVKDYHAPSSPHPGPHTDDHNFNNVNDLATPWEWGSTSPEAYEFIERLAVYMHTTTSGTPRANMYRGLQAWLEDTRLEKSIIVERYQLPSFDFISEAVMQEKCVILLYWVYGANCELRYGHYVTVAGVNAEELMIAISDPLTGSISNNDPSIVQHDIFTVNLNPNCGRGEWAIETSNLYAEVDYAIIISVAEQKPYLKCEGTLSWSDIRPGDIVMGAFTIENAGFFGSELDWEIIEYPEWGTWTFMPSSGDNLKPEDGVVTIQVSVVVPDESNQNFTGDVKIVNKKDSNDFAIIPVSLTIPVNQNPHNSLILWFLEILIDRFPSLARIITTFA